MNRKDSASFIACLCRFVLAALVVLTCADFGMAQGYPESAHPYANNFDYTWTYTLSGGHTSINVTFDPQTAVESGWDYIYVMDGNGSNISGSPFTGTSLAGQTKNVPGATVKIRLRTDGSVTAWGFKVTNVTDGGGGGSITVTSPNGGENWAIGTTQTIQWTSSGVSGNVKIELSRNGGSSWETLFSSTANDGSEAWVVTGSATTAARVRISSVTTPSISDTSNANFTISGGGSGQTAIFLVHGISQSSADMASLGNNLRSTLDPSRFVVDSGFDWSECADNNNCSPTNCEIPDGAQKLAQYINNSPNARNSIVLIGYSMGGLVSRDMLLNNYNTVVSNRRVKALITLGTPNVGYPFCEIDVDDRWWDLLGSWFGKCPIEAQQMASDYRTLQAQNLIQVSTYLSNLTQAWGNPNFTTGKPEKWMAVAGTFCSQPLRGVGVSTMTKCDWDGSGLSDPDFQGCPDSPPDSDPLSDGVVCRGSALFLVNVGNGPTDRWESTGYRHSDGWYWPLENPSGADLLMCEVGSSLHNLYSFPVTSNLFTAITTFLNGLP